MMPPTDSIECKNENCCTPIDYREKQMKEIGAGVIMDGINLITAFNVSVFAVYMFPDCGHLIGDMSSFISTKFMELWRKV